MTPAAVFLGFCAKARAVPEWFRDQPWAGHIDEIASISDCLVARPAGWIERWDFNRASCWNTEAAAVECIPRDADPHDFQLYAWRAVPQIFRGRRDPQRLNPTEMFLTDLPDLPAEPDLSAYQPAGYDIVQYSDYLGHGCSPLTCNTMGEKFPVNRYALLDELEQALIAARYFAQEQTEPGPYIIFEVLRRS